MCVELCLLCVSNVFTSLWWQAGGYMQEELVFTIIAMLSQSDQLHGYHTQRLYVALTNDISQV